jgi:RNA polymerase sigma-70 factor (ECF subfamily)
MKEPGQFFDRLRKGDELAFNEIYLHFFPKLYYFVLEYVKQNDLAENIVQDTMYVLWSKREQLTENTNLSAYLFTVAKNNCMYRLRELRYQRMSIPIWKTWNTELI